MTELACWNCGENLAALPQPISRHNQCPKCFEELHCCRLCIHFDPQNASRCLDDRAEPPMHKENANFCEYWHGNNNAFKPTRKTSGSEAKAKLDALFGNDRDNAADDSEHSADAEETTHQVNAEQPLSAEEKAKAELQALFGARSKKPE